MPFHIKDNIRPISDFRKDSAAMLKKLKENHHPIVLTQRGRSVAVIIDVDTYERLDYENEFRAAVHEGMEDVKQGRTISHEQVMKAMHERLRKLKKK